MDTGVGVPRHPLFFLGWVRRGEKKKASRRRGWRLWGKHKAAAGTEEAVSVSVRSVWRLGCSPRRRPTASQEAVEHLPQSRLDRLNM